MTSLNWLILKPMVWCTILGYIFYISQAKGNFLYKNNHLVTRATRVGTRCHIKDIVKLGDPYNTLLSANISYASWVIANFVLTFANFRYHGNRGRSEQCLSNTPKLDDPQNPYNMHASGVFLYVSWVIGNFVMKFAYFRYHSNKGLSELS